MSTAPRGPARSYDLNNLAFPRVVLATLNLPDLSSDVRTWGELQNYVRANIRNLQAGTYEKVQMLQVHYAEAGPQVPLVPPAGETPATSTSMQATKARGRGNQVLGRGKGKAERRESGRARGGKATRSTTYSEPTPVVQQSEGLATLAKPSRYLPPAPPVYEQALSVAQEPAPSRVRRASAPSGRPSRECRLIRISPPRRGSVVLNVVPGSNPRAEPTVLRSYTNPPIIAPGAMVRREPSAKLSTVAAESSNSSVTNSRKNLETKTKANLRGENTSSSVIDSEIPINVSEALSVFPSLMPRQANQ